MTPARRVAGIIALPDSNQWREFTTRTGPELINGATHFLTYFAAQGDTAWRLAVRATHTHQMRRHRISQSGRDNAPGKLIGFAVVEGHAVGNAAGAAALTGIHMDEFISRNRLLESVALHFAAILFPLPLPI